MRRADLEAHGFTGWLCLIDCARSPKLPDQPGVYAVSFDGVKPAIWPPTSCGGWHKGRDPAVPASRLEAEWVDETDILYIGMTNRTLAKRIGEFSRFGRGEPVGHWGGRLLWQLPDVQRLKIGWRVLPSATAASAESLLFSQFAMAFGRLPFANLRN